MKIHQLSRNTYLTFYEINHPINLEFLQLNGG